MNQTFAPPVIRARPTTPEADSFDLRSIFAIFRRRLWLFLAVFLSVLAIAVAITWTQKPRYSATVSLMIEPVSVGPNEDQRPDAMTGNVDVDNQVAYLKSRYLAGRVASELDLVRDPEFRPGVPEGEPPLDPVEQDRLVTAALMGKVKVERADQSYLVGLTVTAARPEKAARIANAFADIYMRGQVEREVASVQSSADVLDTQLARLRSQVERAEDAVARYRAQHNLMSAEGSTLTEQEISNLNQQLAVAQAGAAEQQARLNSARAQLARGSTGEDLGESLNSAVVQDLRRRRSDVSQRVASLSLRYGDQYPGLVAAKTELEEIDAQIRQEIRRIISNLAAQAQVAQDRVASLQASIAQSRGSLATANQATVRLRELERYAEGLRTVFDAARERYNKVNAGAGAERPNAEIVSRAEPPTSPSAPNKSLNLALGTALALLLGFGAIFVAELLHRGVSTTDEVERLFGLSNLASIPDLASTLDRKSRHEAANPAEFVMRHPLSSFTEALRSLRTAVVAPGDTSPRKVIALASALPNEGKSTTSICLTRVASMLDQRVVLVDCDIRQQKATAYTVGGKPSKGIVEVLNGTATLEEALIKDPGSNAYILPVATTTMPSVDLMTSPALERLVTMLRCEFDLVIIDTTPMLAVADARYVMRLADAVVLLVRWRQTPRDAIKMALRVLSESGANVAGLALTMVDIRKQAASGYGDPGYYYHKYKSYYGE